MFAKQTAKRAACTLNCVHSHCHKSRHSHSRNVDALSAVNDFANLGALGCRVQRRRPDDGVHKVGALGHQHFVANVHKDTLELPALCFKKNQMCNCTTYKSTACQHSVQRNQAVSTRTHSSTVHVASLTCAPTFMSSSSCKPNACMQTQKMLGGERLQWHDTQCSVFAMHACTNSSQCQVPSLPPDAKTS